MNKEEIKQWLRNQIDSCIKIQDDTYNNIYFLYYNNSYLRALKLSKINGNPVNQENFNGGEDIFMVNIYSNSFCWFSKIDDYLNENYSKEDSEQKKRLEEVLDEYDEYKGYKWGW